MNPLIHYIGCEALGEQKQGFKVSKFFKGVLNHSSFIHMDEDKSFTAKPYLRPLESITDDHLEKIRSFIRGGSGIAAGIMNWTRIINFLRGEGYDCDGLIDQGLALLHPDYDAKNLL